MIDLTFVGCCLILAGVCIFGVILFILIPIVLVKMMIEARREKDFVMFIVPFALLLLVMGVFTIVIGCLLIGVG